MQPTDNNATNTTPAAFTENSSLPEHTTLFAPAPTQNKEKIKAMILAAGLGTRLQPFTNHHPKALATVNGKSLLQRNIEYLQQFGIYDVIVNTHHFAKQIEDAVQQNKGWGSNVTLSFEETVLETGGGLKKAAYFFEGDDFFVMMNADVLTNMPLDVMIAQHCRHAALATLATSSRITSRYLLFNDQLQLCGWQNVTTGDTKMSAHAEKYTQLAFSGIQVISRSLLQSLNNFDGKFSIIDVYLQQAASGVIQAFRHDGFSFIDVGRPESIVKAEKFFIP